MVSVKNPRGTDNALLAEDYVTERGTNDAALAAYWTAVRAGYIDVLLLELQHTTEIFPENTNLTCTLTAALAADTWSAWTEIVDSAATTLSSKFTTDTGHISSCVIENLSEVDTVYMLELAYGDNHVIISPMRFAGTTKFLNPSHQERFRGVGSPAGETVYYRMKSATTSDDFALVHFRYHTHS